MTGLTLLILCTAVRFLPFRSIFDFSSTGVCFLDEDQLPLKHSQWRILDLAIMESSTHQL